MKLPIDRPIQYLTHQWEKQPALACFFSILWLLLIGWLAFGWHLGSTGLIDETEPLFAEAARQMAETGDWVTPYFNEETRFDKPPLIYWLMAIAYKILGINTWAVRLPSALSALALVGLGFYTLRCFGYPSPATAHVTAHVTVEDHHRTWPAANAPLWLSAWIGSALIAMHPETLVWARSGLSDMLLSSCMGSALLAFFLGYAQPTRPKVQTGWYLSCYVLLALAVLAKGPVGVVLPGLIIGAFLLYLGKFREVLQEVKLLQGGLIFLILTIPWYVLVIQANGQAYIDSFFGHHNFDRFTSVVNGHAAPWYFYFLVVLLGFAPWSIYLPMAIARLRFWRPHAWRQQPRDRHLALFTLIWFGVIFSFFTISVTKLPSYVLPLMPAAAILVGLLWSDQMTRPHINAGIQFSGWFNILFLTLLAGATLYSPNWMGGDFMFPDFPQVIRQSGVMVAGAMGWAIAALIGVVILLWRQQHLRWLWLVNLLGLTAFLVMTVVPTLQIVDIERQLPLRQIATTIIEVQQPNEKIIMLGFKKPSLVFYTQKRVSYKNRSGKAAKDIQELFDQSAVNSVLLVGHLKNIKNTQFPPNRYQLLDTQDPYQLVRVFR
ncbi:MAG: glycosyltransferase family 39 protein [Cyanothece sp. SIO1E1]|nr:glycosyltransferase family 39 protein [Cyanothece sp. SIO1E1]